MRCPDLNALPPVPPGKSGWPWTEESSQLPSVMSNGSPWPRISIVTPSFNHGKFIEETIRSVLLQGYPNLQYIIMDGGSTDGSVEIIRKYERWLDFWVSQKDDGQAAAINAGLERATGEVVNWLNSDDLFCVGALKRVAMDFSLDKAAILYHGSALRIDHESNFVGSFVAKPLSPEEVLEGGKIPLPQPAIFFRRETWLRHGKLKPHFYCALDTEFFLSCVVKGRSHLVGGLPLAMMRIHENAKTAPYSAWRNIILERLQILSQLCRDPSTPPGLVKHIKYGLNRESLRLARISLSESWNLPEAISWFLRAVMYSPGRTFYRCLRF